MKWGGLLGGGVPVPRLLFPRTLHCNGRQEQENPLSHAGTLPHLRAAQVDPWTRLVGPEQCQECGQGLEDTTENKEEKFR